MNDSILYYSIMVISVVIGLCFLSIVFIIKSLQKRKFSKKLRKVQQSSPYRNNSHVLPKKPNPEQRIKDHKVEVMSQKEYDTLKKQGKLKNTREAAYDEREEEIDEVMRYDATTGKSQNINQNSKNNAVSKSQSNKIVGLAKPKGFWSRFIMGEKLGYIMARIQAAENKKGGFWVNLINAQSMSQGKDQGRGR